MPNWKIHIEIGKRVNEELKFDGENLNLFLLGNILPDLNNKYIVVDIEKEIEHRITHFKYSYLNFYNKYKEQIENRDPLFCGYLLHLYTDYTWNINHAKMLKEKGIGDTYTDELRKIKQNDFKVFNNKFMKNVLQINDYENAINKINQIEEVEINENDLKNVINFLINQTEYEGEYKFFTEEQLWQIMDYTTKNAYKDLFENKEEN